MSIKVMSRVWDFSKASGTPLLVLLCLADWADDEGECWPSISTIATKCRLKDERHVKRVIHEELERKLGEVLVIANAGKTSGKGGVRSNRYRITVHMPDESQTVVEGPPSAVNDSGSGTTPDSGSRTTQTVVEGPPEPSVTHQVEPSKTLAVFDSDFEAVWQHYPRRIERAKALKAYTARRKAGVNAQDLLAATLNYATATVRTDPTYIKHGATFFGPDEPYADFVAGIPEEGAKSNAAGASRSMATVDAVLSHMNPGSELELSR